MPASNPTWCVLLAVFSKLSHYFKYQTQKMDYRGCTNKLLIDVGRAVVNSMEEMIDIIEEEEELDCNILYARPTYFMHASCFITNNFFLRTTGIINTLNNSSSFWIYTIG